MASKVFIEEEEKESQHSSMKTYKFDPCLVSEK